ncbi:MAG TPA: hypothetical protein VJM69_04035 [Dehalococcoidia bacterium]|nr:hypothetical protein [Dehalococcoidia bacterium]
MDLQEVRDLIIIIFGALGSIAFLAFLAVTLAVGIAVRSLIGNVQQTLQSGVNPLLASAQDTANSVRGATRFITDTAVAPVIRLYSFYAGLRRGLGVLTGLRRRKPGR